MKKIISILLAAVMVMALLAGCGSKNKDHTNDNNTPNNNQTTELSGSVATNGSTSMDKVIGALREQFMTDHKNVTVTYDPTGSGSGIEAVKNGTADIGLQALSGAIDRNDDVLYICYDNEAYMNTGIQRSSSTPRFAKATPSPVGSAIPGKLQNKKNLTEIIAAHHVPYVAQTTFLGNFRDLYTKAQKAIYTPGPSFLNIMAPCPRGWEYPAEKLPEICKLAVETCVWPLFEVIDGVWHLSYQPKQKRPVEEYLRLQGRFRHMFKPGNEWMIEEAQRNVDENWEKLLAKCQG